MTTFWHLFVAFFRAGIFGYGGGPGSIPLIRGEVVSTYHWLTDAEFAEALAFGNALPGPIATKLAAFVGYRVAGTPGALVATAGIVVPTALAMVALYGILSAYRDVPWVRGAITAVKPVVAVLLLQVTLDVARTAFPSSAMYIFAAAALVATFVLKLHPALMIAATFLAGALFVR